MQLTIWKIFCITAKQLDQTRGQSALLSIIRVCTLAHINPPPNPTPVELEQNRGRQHNNPFTTTINVPYILTPYCKSMCDSSYLPLHRYLNIFKNTFTNFDGKIRIYRYLKSKMEKRRRTVVLKFEGMTVTWQRGRDIDISPLMVNQTCNQASVLPWSKYLYQGRYIARCMIYWRLTDQIVCPSIPPLQPLISFLQDLLWLKASLQTNT